MSYARRKTIRRRGPNIGGLASSLGYKALELSKYLSDFRLLEYNNEEFSTCTMENLNGLAERFLHEHGCRLFSRQISTSGWPTYPEHKDYFLDTIFEIYKRQRRNVIDMQVRRRRNDTFNGSAEWDSENNEVSDAEDSDHERSWASTSIDPTASEERMGVSYDQMLQGQDVDGTKPSIDEVDLVSPRDLDNGPLSTRGNLKRNFGKMSEDAASHDVQISEPTNQDRWHIHDAAALKGYMDQTTSTETSVSETNSDASKSHVDDTIIVEVPSHRVPLRQEQEPHETRLDFYVHASSIEIAPDNNIPAEDLSSEQAPTLSTASTQTPAARYTSTSCQTPLMLSRSSGTQTIETSTTSQTNETPVVEYQTVSIQTIATEAPPRIFRYDNGSFLMEGGPDIAFALLSTIMNMIAANRKATRLKFREAKTQADRACEQEFASRLRQMTDQIQQEAKVLGFETFSTD